ncbi:hypothetical protein PR048_007858 [Dryococelus australis]|uniref:Uncharacterized protein n=1 Tax=Dryococelus australis TaxID=614101 RepID=A0ABQ9HX20_9NEOP|nr:hypothetical protein PR048_007858 [Dryococelus australis]
MLFTINKPGRQKLQQRIAKEGPTAISPSTSRQSGTAMFKLRDNIDRCKAGPEILPHPTSSQGRSQHGCGCVHPPPSDDQIETVSGIKNKEKPFSIRGGVAPGISHVGFVPDDAAGRRVSSGISRFSHPFIPAMLHTHLTSPSSTLKTSTLRAAHISALYTHLWVEGVRSWAVPSRSLHVTLRSRVKAVHDKVSTLEMNLRKKSLALPAYNLMFALSDINPVKLVTMDGKCQVEEGNRDVRLPTFQLAGASPLADSGLSLLQLMDLSSGIRNLVTDVSGMRLSCLSETKFRGLRDSVFAHLKALEKALPAAFLVLPAATGTKENKRENERKDGGMKVILLLDGRCGRTRSTERNETTTTEIRAKMYTKVRRGDHGAAPECKSEENGRSLRKSAVRRPATSSGVSPTCENQGATPPGIELGSPSRSNFLPCLRFLDYPNSILCQRSVMLLTGGKSAKAGSVWRHKSPSMPVTMDSFGEPRLRLPEDVPSFEVQKQGSNKDDTDTFPSYPIASTLKGRWTGVQIPAILMQLLELKRFHHATYFHGNLKHFMTDDGKTRLLKHSYKKKSQDKRSGDLAGHGISANLEMSLSGNKPLRLYLDIFELNGCFLLCAGTIFDASLYSTRRNKVTSSNASRASFKHVPTKAVFSGVRTSCSTKGDRMGSTMGFLGCQIQKVGLLAVVLETLPCGGLPAEKRLNAVSCDTALVLAWTVSRGWIVPRPDYGCLSSLIVSEDVRGEPVFYGRGRDRPVGRLVETWEQFTLSGDKRHPPPYITNINLRETSARYDNEIPALLERCALFATAGWQRCRQPYREWANSRRDYAAELVEHSAVGTGCVIRGARDSPRTVCRNKLCLQLPRLLEITRGSGKNRKLYVFVVMLAVTGNAGSSGITRCWERAVVRRPICSLANLTTDDAAHWCAWLAHDHRGLKTSHPPLPKQMTSLLKGEPVSLLDSYQGEPGSTPGMGHSRIFANGNRAWTMSLVGGFSRGSPVSPLPSIPALLHTHLTNTLIGSQDRDVKSRSLTSSEVYAPEGDALGSSSFSPAPLHLPPPPQAPAFINPHAHPLRTSPAIEGTIGCGGEGREEKGIQDVYFNYY